MKRIFVLMMVWVALFTGCATTQMLKPEQAPALDPAPDSALLVIVRDAWVGSAIVFWNYVDGKLIGETKGKTYIVTKVAPGPHYVVSATENTGVAQFDFQAGKRYFLKQGIAMGVWRARTSGFFPMTAREAQEAIKGCTYLELDPKAEAPAMEAALYRKAIDEYNADIKANPDGYKELLAYQGE